MTSSLSAPTVAVVLGMAVLTYALKAGGLFALARVELDERSEVVLRALPGSIVVAFLAPELVRGGLAEWGATLAVVVVAWRTGNVLAALSVGLLAVLAIRHWLPVG